MRSSIAIASLCAAFAAGSPIVKKGLVAAAPVNEVVETHVDVVTNVVMVTVTAEPVIVTADAASTPAPVIVTVSQSRPHRHSHSQAAPAPASTSTSAAVVVVTETQPASTQAPATSTTAAAAKVVVSSSSSAAAVVATTAAAAASSATDALSPTAVNAHNTARASHQATAMTWNQTLADYAAQEGSCTTFAHDLTAGDGHYGQNIAVAGNSNSGAYTTEAALAEAIKEWYDEESLYTKLYGQSNPSESAGDFLHFTQIVWQASHQVGCAVKTCGTDNSIYPGMHIWYTVCNYYPAGNVIGQFAANVLS